MKSLCRLTAKDMDGPLAQWDLLATVSQHSDAVIGYADILHVRLCSSHVPFSSAELCFRTPA